MQLITNVTPVTFYQRFSIPSGLPQVANAGPINIAQLIKKVQRSVVISDSPD